MFFRRFPPNYRALWVLIASEFHWTPQVLEELDDDSLRFWFAQVEDLLAARKDALKGRRRR